MHRFHHHLTHSDEHQAEGQHGHGVHPASGISLHNNHHRMGEFLRHPHFNDSSRSRSSSKEPVRSSVDPAQAEGNKHGLPDTEAKQWGGDASCPAENGQQTQRGRGGEGLASPSDKTTGPSGREISSPTLTLRGQSMLGTSRENEDLLAVLNIGVISVEADRNRGMLEEWQEASRKVFQHWAPRFLFAILIMASFIIDIVETQMLPLGRNDAKTGEMLATGITFMQLEIAFTIIFTLELSWNCFSNWFWGFFGSSWNLFDLAVVVTSIVSVAYGGTNVKSIRVVRVLRALRSMRVLKSLRKIVRALTLAVYPVLSVCFVAVIVVSVFAILGVNFYAERSPVEFGDFGRAVWTLLTAATLEGWVEYASQLFGDEPGDLDAGVILYFTAYVLIVGYVLTSVIIAVLLENFADATQEEVDGIDLDEEVPIVNMDSHQVQHEHPLDPLLDSLIQAESAGDLQRRLDALFDLLDAEDSGRVAYEQMRRLEALDVHPRIKLSGLDFDLLSGGGQLTRAEFGGVLRRELRDYVSRQMVKQARHPDNERLLSSLFAGVNWLMISGHESTQAGVTAGAGAPPRASPEDKPTGRCVNEQMSLDIETRVENRLLQQQERLENLLHTRLEAHMASIDRLCRALVSGVAPAAAATSSFPDKGAESRLSGGNAPPLARALSPRSDLQGLQGEIDMLGAKIAALQVIPHMHPSWRSAACVQHAYLQRLTQACSATSLIHPLCDATHARSRARCRSC